MSQTLETPAGAARGNEDVCSECKGTGLYGAKADPDGFATACIDCWGRNQKIPLDGTVPDRVYEPNDPKFGKFQGRSSNWVTYEDFLAEEVPFP